MYQKFFGLRESPFNVNPDPRYLFLTKQIQEALAGLTYGIQNRKGLHPADGRSGHREDDAVEPAAGLAARAARGHGFHFQFAAERQSAIRFHDGGV